jgi:formylglycine-generating enzyme required for sulfatase activity
LIVISPTTITAVTPTGTLGPADVIVTTPAGTLTSLNGFAYVAIVVPTWATLLELLPDPAVVTDANLSSAIATSGFAWRVRDNATNIEMLLVPAGTFMMGCSLGDAKCGGDENPAHQVTLTNAFYMGKTEVTQAQWQATMGSNPSFFVAGNGFPGSFDRPVEQVNWNMIQGFNTATGLRLPTEAEWEFACRAGTTTALYGVLNDIAWHSDNSGDTTHAVATKLPNALGLYDTIGNVWEWCQDLHSSTYYASSPLTNPTGPTTGEIRLLRGGGWSHGSNGCRASQRGGNTPGWSYNFYGFRVVRTP